MSDRASVTAATCVVSVAGHVKGSGFLIDVARVVTAAHVVSSAGDGREIKVDFRVGLTGVAAASDGIPAVRVTLGEGAAALDVAVLDLDSHPEGVEAMPVWPGRRLPEALELFGFPRADRTGRGSWVRLERARPIGDRQVQVDWARDVGSLGGHSGGPVVDVETWSVVGVLVEGSQEGGFDRVVPMRALADPQVWAGWRLPWLYGGLGAERHFRLRARGQRSTDRGGDLFAGRTVALAAIHDRAGRGRPVVVTGHPGSGKSSVVARLGISLADDPASDDGVLFHAREATAEQLVDALAAKVGLAGVSSGPELVDRLGATGVSLWVVVDALDEARTDTDRRQLAKILNELATVADVRVVVATRRSSHDPYGPTSPLRLLGVRSHDDAGLIDLDRDDFFEPAALIDYAQGVLCQSGADRPTPPGGAWEIYRTDRPLARRLATTIADRAGRTYLVAAMAADELGRRSQYDVVDPVEFPRGNGDP